MFERVGVRRKQKSNAKVSLPIKFDRMNQGSEMRRRDYFADDQHDSSFRVENNNQISRPTTTNVVQGWGDNDVQAD